MAALNGQQIHEAASRLKQFNIPEALNLLPKSEMQVLSAVNKLHQNKAGKLVYASEVALAIGVTAPAVSRTLRILENKEYIKRIINTSDRRNVCILITGAGQEALEQNIRKMTEFIERVLAHLEEEEIEQFTRIYEKVFESIKIELDRNRHRKGE